LPTPGKPFSPKALSQLNGLEVWTAPTPGTPFSLWLCHS